ncbi:MAG: SDR family oxidoreductase [Kutzneria sp.]|nr:SDR family oxidoreductase [Kutzneria sp.]
MVTGAGRGIGAALARRFAAESAAGIVVSDIDGEAAQAVATELAAVTRAVAVRADVSVAKEVAGLVQTAEREFGPVDLFCSNAGVSTGCGVEDATEGQWALAWSVNVMAHVHAARAVLPSMLARGRGYLLNTVSAAGLLMTTGDAPYTATKHAAIGFAEWLSVNYGDRGVGVSALCPMGVRTEMLMSGIERGSKAALAVAAAGPILTPEEVAEATMDGLAEERFLILPHPEVAEFEAGKVADRDRWLEGMRRSVASEPVE